MMALVEICERLKESIGLDPEIVGIDTIGQAVAERMAALGLSGMSTYLDQLGTGREMEELIESVVVPETWFYRDSEPFRFLTSQAVLGRLLSLRAEPLHILSAPCSTGEEPYSIAVALLEGGLTPDRFRIDAVDISARALATAARAMYGRNSFRGTDLGFRERYLERDGSSFRVPEAVSSTVRFLQGNLLDKPFPCPPKSCHVVFCRNLLIYLTPQARAKVLAALSQLLARPGLLFVGHAETLLVTLEGLEGVSHPGAFAFWADEVPGGSLPDGVLEPGRAAAGAGAAQSPEAAGRPIDTAITASDLQGDPVDRLESADPEVMLDNALRAADEGNLAEADGLCNRCIAGCGPSAQAYFILGLVREAFGSLDHAEACFHKAVYLNPDHYEALIHLALLTRRRDTVAATLIEQRAHRVRVHQAI